MATDLENLQSIKSLYLTALAEEAANPQPNYSLDGESVDYNTWRQTLLARVKEINELLLIEEPFEIRTVIAGV